MKGGSKKFPEGMVPIGNTKFSFECHPGVSCFTVCCKNVDLTLYPYDVIRLKRSLGMDSEDFMREHSFIVQGDNPCFPTVKLKLRENADKSCPFLTKEGCSVYNDRPSACRTYPIERAVGREAARGHSEEFYFMTDHPYCLGHNEEREFTTKTWIRNQRLLDYNAMNELWVEIDSLFSSNPWRGEGAGGEKQQIAFMVCYNIDGFRRFVNKNQLIKKFAIAKDFKMRIAREDEELLKFGFEWLKTILAGKSSLVKK